MTNVKIIAYVGFLFFFSVKTGNVTVKVPSTHTVHLGFIQCHPCSNVQDHEKRKQKIKAKERKRSMRTSCYW